MIHVPVLYSETMDLLVPSASKVVVDGTLGRAGHTQGFLDRGAKVIGFDQDLEAINQVVKRFELRKINEDPYIFTNDVLTIVHRNFSEMDSILTLLDIRKVDGIFLDLGVSSPQFDDADRGFSYRFDAKLDMRMDQTQYLSAYDIVNTYELEKLASLIREYGEERFAWRIAQKIVENRPISTTFELIDLIKSAMPKKALKEQHPAKRTFQALRIAVNDELGALKRCLSNSIDLLNEGGRIGIISFHSLEDRIVKDFFKEQQNPCICPKDLPVCMCERKQTLKIITRKPVLPSESEIESNRRAQSAKLRVAERIREKEEVGK